MIIASFGQLSSVLGFARNGVVPGVVPVRQSYCPLKKGWNFFLGSRLGTKPVALESLIRKSRLNIDVRSITIRSSLRESQKAEFTDKLDAYLNPQFSPSEPGGVLQVLVRGKPRYLKAFGLADLERSVSITEKTVFDIGSVSKQFTAACIALLAHRGKVDLKEKVAFYLGPDWKDSTGDAVINDLLFMRSGIRDFLELRALKDISLREQVARAGTLTLIKNQRGMNFSPNERFEYSNSNYVLLAEIVERVSGVKFRDFVKEELFERLGMDSSIVSPIGTDVVKGRALGYNQVRGGKAYSEMSHVDLSGAGGIHTTVLDLAKWDANFEENKLGGGQELVDMLCTLPKTRENASYAWGLMVSDDFVEGERVVWHAGGWLGYRSIYLRVPAKRTSVIFLSNNTGRTLEKLVKAVACIVLGRDCTKYSEFSPTSDREDSHRSADSNSNTGGTQRSQGRIMKSSSYNGSSKVELEKCSGLFESKELGQILHLRTAFNSEGAVLHIDTAESGEAVVAHSVKATFPSFLLNYRGQRVTLTFEGADTLRVKMPEAEFSTTFARIRKIRVRPRELAAYTGEFYSSELDFIYKVEANLQYSGLKVTPISGSSTTWNFYLCDENGIFKGSLGRMQFQKNDSGKFDGFLLSVGRIKNVHFQKIPGGLFCTKSVVSKSST